MQIAETVTGTGKTLTALSNACPGNHAEFIAEDIRVTENVPRGIAVAIVVPRRV